MVAAPIPAMALRTMRVGKAIGALDGSVLLTAISAEGVETAVAVMVANG